MQPSSRCLHPNAANARNWRRRDEFSSISDAGSRAAMLPERNGVSKFGNMRPPSCRRPGCGIRFSTVRSRGTATNRLGARKV